MKLSLGEIRNNAIRFSKEWEDASNEQAEAQSFWTDLFAVYGIKRRSVASFEEHVKNLAGNHARIDVFYSGVMLGEHKSRGEDLSKAKSQAFDYIQSLTREARHDEIPQYIVLSDFARIVVYDLESKDPDTPFADFPTAKLHENISNLLFLAGQTTRPLDPEDPINIRAVEILGELHDALEKGGYNGHELERFLVRILFCLFADDTVIFEPDAVKRLVKESRDDGFGLGAILEQLFQVLDTPKDKRPANLPEEFREMPYVNGKLFSERLRVVNFDADTRTALLDACEFNWSRISPAVFGSLFQSIMAGDEGSKKRRQIGAHYTSERDILKLINSLFLDDLKAELDKTTTKPKLQAFQEKLASLKFLDPACGCGNFLVVAYRELRLLEIECLKKLHTKKKGEVQRVLNVAEHLMVNVDQMHGIEIEEWPARIAEVAMWLVDHQMNVKVGEEFGEPVLRLPLTRSAKILHANALRTDWNDVLPAAECNYVMGNPPFIGHHLQNEEQKSDQNRIWHDVDGRGVLDFVTCWYRKAAEYIEESTIQCGFVSTNSIAQGEQPGIFWPKLIQLGLIINFAHRTFKWISEARGKAKVHVVIIGFGMIDTAKHIWEYDNGDGNLGRRSQPTRISPYLFDGPAEVLQNRTKPICNIPGMKYGNKPTDGGNFILSPAERDQIIDAHPEAAPHIRRYIGASDFLDGTIRYCLWIPDISPSVLKAIPPISDRVKAVRSFRMASKAASTRQYANYPTRFRQIAQTEHPFILIPRHTSENRQYIPFAYFEPSVIASDACFFIPNAQPFHFGIISSEMHIAWVRQFCGRIKSDFRYSKDIVYNNFPWPQNPTPAQVKSVEAAAHRVLDAREQFPDQTLADLYDPLAMPKPLRDAHNALDRAVDRCYRPQPFTSERARVEYLFALYQKLVAPLTAAKKKSKKKKATRKKK